MGGTSTSREELSDRAAYRSATGTSFAHTSAMRSRPVHEQTIHESVDPKRRNTLGVQIRECLDSDAHPLTVPVVVGFDETASMADAPIILQQKLATLKAATLRMGLDDAQLCFAAYGDAQNGEVAPCQVGQFESGIEMEDWLNNLYLERMGGGNRGETPGLLLWFLANYTSLDSLKKRGKKGYLILIGDERPLPMVTREEIKRYIDGDVQGDLTIDEVVAQALESFEIFFFLVKNRTAEMQGSEAEWKRLLGDQNVIVTQGLDTISEQIALLIARLEGTIDDLDAGMDILVAEGASADDVRRAGQALVPLDTHVGTSVATATTSGSLPTPATAGTSQRL